MQFLSSWATHDRKVLLHFSDQVLKTFNDYIQSKSTDSEAGGLLLGTVHGDNILVSEATTPTEWDERLRYFFERMPFGHSEIALARWQASQGFTRYLGEWHTHPEELPQPSHLDRSEWSRLSASRKDGRPMLAVIVGQRNLRVELIAIKGLGIALQPVE